MFDRPFGHIDAVQPRHRDVENGHVGAVRFTHAQRFQAVARLADDFDVVFGVEQRLQPTPYDAVIVTEHYSQRGSPCCCPQRAPAG